VSPPITDFLDRVTEWAAHQPAIAGVALVGSHARGEARPDSDIDLVLLCMEPDAFLTETSWINHFGAVETCQTEHWGRVTSLRVYYKACIEVEFGLTSLGWAALPVDPGTKHVVAQGMRILWDQAGLLGRLRDAVCMP
jgi:predicted nucleotidyltransferase